MSGHDRVRRISEKRLAPGGRLVVSPSTNRPGRAIGILMPCVVVEELLRDDQVETDHPRERDSTVSDHGVQLPARIEMHCSRSDGPFGKLGCVEKLHRALGDLQASREPFDV